MVSPPCPRPCMPFMSKLSNLRPSLRSYCANDFPSYPERPATDCDADGVLTNGMADRCGQGPGADPVGWTMAVYDLVYEEQTATFRGAGLAGKATIGADKYRHQGLSGTLAMFQIYPGALPPSRVRCVHEEGQRLVQSGRLALLADTTCRQAVPTGCTSEAANNGPELGQTAATAMVDDNSCSFEHLESASSERGVVHATDEWQIIALAGSYVKPLIFCGVMSRSSTVQVRVHPAC